LKMPLPPLKIPLPPLKSSGKSSPPAVVAVPVPPSWSNASTGHVWLHSGHAWGAHSGHVVIQSGVSGTAPVRGDGGGGGGGGGGGDDGTRCEEAQPEGRGSSGNVWIKGGDSAFGYGGHIVLQSGKYTPPPSPRGESDGAVVPGTEATLVLNGGRHAGVVPAAGLVLPNDDVARFGNAGDIVLRPGTPGSSLDEGRRGVGGALLFLDASNATRFSANDTTTVVTTPHDGGALFLSSRGTLHADAGSNVTVRADAHLDVSSGGTMRFGTRQSQIRFGADS
jgi:hypothetical protein